MLGRYGNIISIFLIATFSLFIQSCHPPRLVGWELSKKVAISVLMPKSTFVYGEYIAPVLRVQNLSPREITIAEPDEIMNIAVGILDSTGEQMHHREVIGCFVGLPPAIHLEPHAIFLAPVVIDSKDLEWTKYNPFARRRISQGRYRLFLLHFQDGASVSSDTVSFSIRAATEPDSNLDTQIENLIRIGSLRTASRTESLVVANPDHPYLARIFLDSSPLDTYKSLSFMEKFPNSGLLRYALKDYIASLERNLNSKFHWGEFPHKQTIQALLDFKASTQDTILQHFIDQELR